MPDAILTRDRAAAHEALVIRLLSLVRQVEAVALRRPAEPVPAETRIAAEGLLYDTEHLLLPGRRSRPLPPAAQGFAGLATQLGQALARLEAFEVEHSMWNGTLNCLVWRTAAPHPLPVRRLRPRIVTPPGSERQSREAELIRKKLIAHLTERYEEGYEQALKDAREGRVLPQLNPYETDTIQKT